MLKNVIRKFFVIALLMTSLCTSVYAATPDYQVENQPLVIEKVIQVFKIHSK
jgi:hypothetical protein